MESDILETMKDYVKKTWNVILEKTNNSLTVSQNRNCCCLLKRYRFYKDFQLKGLRVLKNEDGWLRTNYKIKLI